MYKKKRLFLNTNGTWAQEASAIEAIYAYVSSAGEKKISGRYRIRMTKMSGPELVAMGLAPEETPPEFFGLQASLDKWHQDNGWIPLFDWVGDPEASLKKIEKDLSKQFQAFITGIPIESDFGFDLPKPPTPEKNTFKKPKPKKEPKVDKVEDKKPPSSEPPDFEWI